MPLYNVDVTREVIQLQTSAISIKARSKAEAEKLVKAKRPGEFEWADHDRPFSSRVTVEDVQEA